MLGILMGAVRAFLSAIIDARSLALENMALRHQLGVLERHARRRPRLTRLDRALWVWLSRTWSGWKDALRIARPETVIAWHRRGWRLYWAGAHSWATT